MGEFFRKLLSDDLVLVDNKVGNWPTRFAKGSYPIRDNKVGNWRVLNQKNHTRNSTSVDRSKARATPFVSSR